MKTYSDIKGDGGSNIVEQVTQKINRLNSRLASIRHTIAIMSGKGGVGKSSVTVNLATALALDGHSVGIMDADINGPSIAKMTGVRNHTLQAGKTGMLPAVNSLGMKIMSMDLFLPNDQSPVEWQAADQHDAFTWRSMMEMGALRELIADTEWGELDFMLIDLPPGTEKLSNIVDVLPGLSGTIVVTIPSAVSRLIVGKSIFMANDRLASPIIGLIENMAAHVCSNCGHEEALFPDADGMVNDNHYDIPLLGKIPFDSRLAISADTGAAYLQDFPQQPAALALKKIAKQIKLYFED